jgi:hypothetical protein
MPEISLPRGARPVAFLPDGSAMVVLRGELWHKNFRLVDLRSGSQRQLTNFGRRFIIGDFEISVDGGEIVFDRLEANSEIVMIDLGH